MRVPAGRWRQSGQALVEAVVALLALGPLFVAAYLLWMWQDATHAALVAARYAAFDAALAEGQEPGSGIRPALPGSVLDARARGWLALDPGGASLVADDAVRVAVRRLPLPGSQAQTESTALSMLAPALALGQGEFDLRPGGAVAAHVSLRFEPTVFPGLGTAIDGPRIAASLYLPADPWRASSVDMTRRRTAALSMAGRMSDWVGPLRAVRGAVSVIEPAFERLCLGRIAVEIVPADRITGASTPPADLRHLPC